jgi:uncharacterized protein YkwD
MRTTVNESQSKGHDFCGRLLVCVARFGALLVFLALLVSCESIIMLPEGSKPIPYTWNKETVDTTAGAEYLNDSERQVIIEINMVRTNPAEYARSFLAPLRSYYRNKLLRYPGDVAVLTREGVRALDECMEELRVTKPLSALSPQKGLTLAARDHARDQAITGATGHAGRGDSTFSGRLNRYGQWDISAGEIIDYGHRDPRKIVTALLIDDGVSSRDHRRNLLNGSFKFVGVSVGAHNFYGYMCVIDFAGSYR